MAFPIFNDPTDRNANWDLQYNQQYLKDLTTDWRNIKADTASLTVPRLNTVPTSIPDLSQMKPPTIAPSQTFSTQFQNSTFGQNFGTWSQGLNMANTALTSILGPKKEYNGPKGGITQGMDSAYDTISDAVSVIPGWGQAASLLMKANKGFSTIANKLGAGTDGMTTQDAILGSSFFQMSPLGLVNGTFGKTSDTITKDDEAFETVGAAYAGTDSTVDDALQKSGKKYGAFSNSARKAANREIAEAKRQQNIMAGIAENATDRFAIRNSMSAINGNQRALALQGGYNQGAVRVGKNGLSTKLMNRVKSIPTKNLFKEGGKLEIVEEVIDIAEDWIYEEAPEKFEKGGRFNIIPEGALHARKHDIDIEGITKKGIPVISESEGGEIEQQAEIEHSEIIFRLSVTEQIEKAIKDSEESTQKEKDALAIQIGKLLVQEILFNTDDRTNLLNNE